MAIFKLAMRCSKFSRVKDYSINFANSPIFIETIELCSFRIDHALYLMRMYTVQQRQALI